MIKLFKGPRWGALLPAVPEPELNGGFAPRHYICRRARGILQLDGRLDKPFWDQAPWSEDFVDITGKSEYLPEKRTRFKTLWDDSYLYIGAELEENEIWATLTERDALICHDNNFEVFLDPDGDTHNYYELEINALGTLWDLFLPKPYRDGGPRVNSWDIRGIRAAVHLSGELNNPRAQNKGWSVEMALPWRVLRECARNGESPQVNDVWRMNFSRVKWELEVQKGQYVKPEHSKEANWVWSPQGLVNMHYPELWGYLLFAEGPAEFSRPPDEEIKWELRRLYYRQRNFYARHGCFCSDFARLKGRDSWTTEPLIEVTTSLFQARVLSRVNRSALIIREDGRVWVEYPT